MQRNNKNYIFLAALLFNFFFETNLNAEEMQYKTAEQYYLDGLYSYCDRSYTTSSEQFEALSKNHPSSPYTRNSLVMEAYTNYINKEYEKTKSITSIFFKLFPNDEYEPYMLYILGMSYYINIRDINRGVNNIIESKQIFTDLLNKHPQSKYAENVKKKIIYIDKIKQLSDVLIGETYQKNNNFISAIRRYSYILDTYKNIDPGIEERTLCNMISSLRSLKMTYNMEKYIKIIKEKYPKSKCLKEKIYKNYH